MMKNRGFTLIEVLIALGILGIIILGMYGILKGGMDIWRGGKEKTDVIAQARLAMDRLTRELRATDEILGCTAGEITFSTELTGDATDERIRYYSAETYLYRSVGVAGADNEIARNIDTFTLTYYSQDGDGVYLFSSPPSTATARNSIWMVEIETKVQTGLSGEEAEVNLRSSVHPRNYPKW
jgi:prepilin-type N-terminal cleavage/methylation domain-containing protein